MYPSASHMITFDIPGLFKSSSKEQGDKGKQAVTQMIENYIRMKRSIILLVVSARASFHNHEGPGMVQKVLGEVGSDLRDRVVGVITNPDVPLSRSEMFKLLSGELDDLNLKFGWHVVRNQSKEERDALLSLDHRDEDERKFFNTEDWKNVPQEKKGIATLRGTLREVLRTHVNQELPAVISEVRAKKKSIEARLNAANDERAPTIFEQNGKEIRGSNKIGDIWHLPKREVQE
jgi:hypothetical protein